jgi:hypothetical protein
VGGEVVPNLGRAGDGTSQLSVAIRYLGNYSITQVQAQFSPDGKNLVPPRSVRIEEAEFTAQGVATWVPCEYPISPERILQHFNSWRSHEILER